MKRRKLPSQSGIVFHVRFRLSGGTHGTIGANGGGDPEAGAEPPGHQGNKASHQGGAMGVHFLD